MNQSLGELLDKDDRNRVDGIRGEKSDDSDVVRRSLFGELASRMLQSGSSTLFFGPQATAPSRVLTPFLFFNKTLALELCSGCPQARDSSLIKPFIQKGVLLVFMRSSFGRTPDSFQKLAYDYSEYFIGNVSYDLYCRMASNPIDPNHPEHHHHYNPSEVISKLISHTGELQNLSSPLKEIMTNNMEGIRTLPSPAAKIFADRYLEILKSPTLDKANELSTALLFSYYIGTAKALEVTPQINVDYLTRFDLFTNGIRISVPEGTPTDDYLDLAISFRGTLPSSIVPSEASKILTKSREINTEIAKLQSSKRMKAGVLVTKSLKWLPSLTMSLVTNGRFSIEGQIKPPLPKIRGSNTSGITARILSRYFGVDNTTIRVWQIRKALPRS